MTAPDSPSHLAYAASALMREAGLRPRKRWGQNFICDPRVVERVARAAGAQSDDCVLEIGPGLGPLTRYLAEHCRRVTAYEIDPLLRPILDRTLAGLDNVTIHTQDFLEPPIEDVLAEAFDDRPGVVAANIPYYITTPILERLFLHRRRIRRIALLVQKEVAERMAAPAGSDPYGSLSVFAQFHARIEIHGQVARGAFFPPPEVSSAIVSLEIAPDGTIEVDDEKMFFRVVRAAFGQRRKTLQNALAGGLTDFGRSDLHAALERAEIEPTRRGETLDLREFAKLAREIGAIPRDVEN